MILSEVLNEIDFPFYVSNLPDELQILACAVGKVGASINSIRFVYKFDNENFIINSFREDYFDAQTAEKSLQQRQEIEGAIRSLAFYTETITAMVARFHSNKAIEILKQVSVNEWVNVADMRYIKISGDNHRQNFIIATNFDTKVPFYIVKKPSRFKYDFSYKRNLDIETIRQSFKLCQPYDFATRHMLIEQAKNSEVK